MLMHLSSRICSMMSSSQCWLFQQRTRAYIGVFVSRCDKSPRWEIGPVKKSYLLAFWFSFRLGKENKNSLLEQLNGEVVIWKSVIMVPK